MPELGKYAETVLTAYAATIVLVAAIIVLSVMRSRKIKKQLKEMEARRNG